MKVKSLDKKWKEFLFAFSGFGPNFLMVLMGAYFTDAINPAGLNGNPLQAILPNVCLIMPILFSVLFTLAKIFDGIIDIPFAHITDTLSTKWGRRRPAILVCMIPMIISFTMCWIPLAWNDSTAAQLINTFWIVFWALIFFSTYTMCLIAFYGSLSTTCSDEPQRLRVSTYKSFFDTISYCLVYALVPLLLEAFNLRIHQFVYICLPLMLTIAIPLFMIKEGKKYGYPENEGLIPEKVKIRDSIKLTFANKTFSSFLCVNGCTFFGLQMFLVGMNAMILGGMGMNGMGMAILNTCAFAPVPLMLYLFNKLKAKRGIRFAYQTAMIAFAVAIMSFFFGSKFICGDNVALQYVIGCVGSVTGSWAIGAFFMVPYLVPAQISSVEEKLTGKNHSAMYFAGNAVVTSVIGAIASYLVYDNLKMFFFKSGAGFAWAENLEQAADKLGVVYDAVNGTADGVFNFGVLIVPFIVAAVMILGFVLCFRMPKDYTPECVAMELKKHNPALDISSIVDESRERNDKSEAIFVQVGLSIISGFIAAFFWLAFLLKNVKDKTSKSTWWLYLLGAFVPFAGIFVSVKADMDLKRVAEARGIKMSAHLPFHIVAGLILPILPVNLISLALMQHNLNKLYAADKNEAPEMEVEIVAEEADTPVEELVPAHD